LEENHEKLFRFGLHQLRNRCRVQIISAQSCLRWRNELPSSRCYICFIAALRLANGATPGSLALKRLPPISEMREGELSWLSTVLYGMIGYALLSAIVVGFWGIRALRFKQLEEAGGNLEPVLRGWLEDTGLSTKTAADPAWDFGLVSTLPDGESIYIVQMKEHRRFVTFQANLAISPEHQAILKAMPGAYFEKLAQEVVLKVFLAKMVLAIRTRLSDVSLFSQLAITDLTKDAFFKHLDAMDNAILLARNIILRGVERAPRLVSLRDMHEHR
jgi:hypothetical protein